MRLFLFALVIISFNDSYAQLWKQYSDSAKAFSDQKNIEKAIKYYYKAKDELQKDSMWTNSYAGICYSIGALYYNMRQYKKTEPLFIEVQKIRENVFGKEHPDYIASCNNLAVLYVKMVQYKKAEPLFIEAKNLREKTMGKGNSDYAFSCNSLGILYEEMGLFEKAEPFLIEAKNIREKVLGKDHYDYAVSCNNLAIAYKERGQYEKAEPLYVEAKNILEKVLGKKHPDYAAICDGLGVLYYYSGQHKRAEPLLVEAKNIREKEFGKDHPDYGSSCLNLAILYEKMGQYEKAESLTVEAKNIREKVLGKEHPDYASSCNSLAILYKDMGEYEKAEPLYLEAKRIKEKVLGKEHPDYASSCNNLATLYHQMGQYAKAEPLYSESKQIREKMLGKEHPEYAVSCNNFAVLYFDMGQYAKAEPLYTEARQIWGKALGKEHPDYAGNCNNLAHLYYAMGQYEKALFFCLEAKQITEKILGKEHPDYADNCNNLALLYKDMGQYEKAEPLYLEAKRIKEKVLGKEHPSYAVSCDNLAGLYMDQGQFEKAEPLYFEANVIIEKALGKEHPEYGRSCNNFANLYKEMGQYEKAEPLYTEARQIWGKALGKEHLNYAGSCNNLGFLYWNLQDYKKAHDFFTEAFMMQYNGVKKIFQFTSETEKQSYLKNITDLGENSLSFNTTVWPPSRQGFTYNVSLTNRNLILSSSQQLRAAINNSNDTSIKRKYTNWMSSREQLSFWYSKPNSEQAVYVKDLEERANVLEKELTSLSAEFRKGQAQNVFDWQTIQQNLQTNEAAIEFVEFEYHDSRRWTDSSYYIALILRKDKPEPELVRLYEKRQLDSLLNKRSQLTQGGKNFIDSLYLSKSAYNLIWRPLEKNLKGITKVYFAPAGLLHRISFAAIPVNNKEVLSDKYQLVQLNTTASVVKLPVNFLSASDKIILYGGVKYDADSSSLKQASLPYATNSIASVSLPRNLTRSDRGDAWQYLPATQEEINEIERFGKQKKMSLTLFDNVNASEESIKSLNAKNSPAVLHVATHGFFFPDPKENKKDDLFSRVETSGKVFRKSDNPLFRSGLLFAGANNAWKGKPIEGVEDGILTAYEVSNLYLSNTKLVVLSACETGLGDIQGSEGVYGLQRSFKMAGVQNLVMSLWKVPDEATSEFMKLFYQNMFNKQSISDAFYHAQAAMKNKYRSNPYNWAAWVLVR